MDDEGIDELMHASWNLTDVSVRWKIQVAVQPLRVACKCAGQHFRGEILGGVYGDATAQHFSHDGTTHPESGL
jgi:hypothetical protein